MVKDGEDLVLRQEITDLKYEIRMMKSYMEDFVPKIREIRGYLKQQERDNFREKKEAMIKENELVIKKLQEENNCHRSDIQAFERKFWEEN